MTYLVLRQRHTDLLKFGRMIDATDVCPSWKEVTKVARPSRGAYDEGGRLSMIPEIRYAIDNMMGFPIVPLNDLRAAVLGHMRVTVKSGQIGSYKDIGVAFIEISTLVRSSGYLWRAFNNLADPSSLASSMYISSIRCIHSVARTRWCADRAGVIERDELTAAQQAVAVQADRRGRAGPAAKSAQEHLLSKASESQHHHSHARKSLCVPVPDFQLWQRHSTAPSVYISVTAQQICTSLAVVLVTTVGKVPRRGRCLRQQVPVQCALLPMSVRFVANP
eukprot:6173364-Pleurochrysis_carterae.AAC.4